MSRYRTSPMGAPRQQGAALIVTLMVLVVITVLGVAAMRLGLTGLALSTNAQINSLLFQSADMGIVSFENSVNKNGGMYAYFTKLSQVTGATELVYCQTTTAISQQVCSPTTSSNYTSGRGAVLVQIAFAKAPNALVLGQDSGSGAVQNLTFSVRSTSLMPNVGGVSSSSINTCLAMAQTSPVDPIDDPLADCLITAGANTSTLVQEYVYMQ